MIIISNLLITLNMQYRVDIISPLQHTATHCNTLQHTATHCNTLQHTESHCITLQMRYRIDIIRGHDTSTDYIDLRGFPFGGTPNLTTVLTRWTCNIVMISNLWIKLNMRYRVIIICPLQHSATHCNALQHTATHCNTLYNTTHAISRRHNTSCTRWRRIVGCLIFMVIFRKRFL